MTIFDFVIFGFWIGFAACIFLHVYAGHSKVNVFALWRDKSAMLAELKAARAETARWQAAVNKWNGAVTGFAAHSKKYQPTDCWKTLGIDPTRDKKAVMRAFKAKAKTAHPDKGGSSWAFQKLFEARNQALANCK